MGLSPRKSHLPHPIFPFPSSSLDLPSTGRNTVALFPWTGPCLGAWTGAQVRGQEQNPAKEG